VIRVPWLFVATGLGGLVASQGIGWAVTRLVAPGEERVLIPGVLSVFVLHNPGVAFGWLGHLAPTVVAGLALTVLAVLFYNRTAWPGRSADQWGFGLVVGGALANVVDRLRFGYVVDYFDVHVWPVFNLADAAIVAGVSVLATASLVRRRRGDTGVTR
jgi:signal peptidase II